MPRRSDSDTAGAELPAPADDTDPPPAICVELAAEGKPPFDSAWLADRFAAICDQLEVGVKHMNVVVVDDAGMSRLHERFRGEAATTDVLSFDLRQETGAPGDVDGEVYVNRDEAARRSQDLGHALGHELLLYATHGLLHLVGYDDADEPARQRMHEKEDALLNAIGVGPVFKSAGGNSK